MSVTSAATRSAAATADKPGTASKSRPMRRTIRPSNEPCLPPPPDLGLPKHFPAWRPGQSEIIAALGESQHRASVLALPTGSGKTLAYMGAAKFLDYGRAAILTSTRGLQDQIESEFIGLNSDIADIRGMANYPCVVLADRSRLQVTNPRHFPAHLGCDRGPCRGGEDCTLRAAGCHYFDQQKIARSQKSVLTNYAYWLAIHEHSPVEDPLGKFDCLIMDEAHEIPDEVCRYLGTEITIEKCREYGLPLWPWGSDSIQKWAAWGRDCETTLKDETGDPDEVRRQREMMLRIGRFTSAGVVPDRWVVECVDDWKTKEPSHVALHPIWPAPYMESRLFRHIPKLIFSSATIIPKTMSVIGLEPDEYDFLELPSPFPVENRLVTHVPTQRVDARTPTRAAWFRRIDQIVGARLDRKGIIHAVSYARAKEIKYQSMYSDRMIVPNSQTTRQEVEAFKRSKEPLVLVSPAVTTGYDFPGKACEYQIICKIPFPDTRSAVMKARQKTDKEYGTFIAAVRIVQAVGRGVRFLLDSCETFIIDDHWQWFKKKAWKFFPTPFRNSVRRADILPRPPAPLSE